MMIAVYVVAGSSVVGFKCRSETESQEFGGYFVAYSSNFVLQVLDDLYLAYPTG